VESDTSPGEPGGGTGHWTPHVFPPYQSAWRRRIWLHLLLLLLTLFTTTTLGARLSFNFQHNLPPFDVEHDLLVFVQVFRDPSILLLGLPYALTLLLILLAHEFGHWFACYYHGIDASLPYFLPAPTFIGTFGAFIRFRSAVKSRRELFDVGVAGPLAGFAFSIPAMGIGLALSKVVPGIGAQAEMQLGTPILFRLIELWLFPGALPPDIYLHPVARAAWVGMLLTALNLLPVGQLDGGHIVYACFGEKHRFIALASIVLLIPLGFVYWPWWLYAVVLFFVGRKHFYVFDAGPLGRGRWQLLAVTLVIFALAFIPAPVQYNSEQGLLP
jgi:Zn-dependent protease